MIGERLQGLRERANKTRKEVAIDLRVHESTYGKYELGKRVPDLTMIYKFLEYFNISANYLLTGNEPHLRLVKKEREDVKMFTGRVFNNQRAFRALLALMSKHHFSLSVMSKDNGRDESVLIKENAESTQILSRDGNIEAERIEGFISWIYSEGNIGRGLYPTSIEYEKMVLLLELKADGEREEIESFLEVLKRSDELAQREIMFREVTTESKFQAAENGKPHYQTPKEKHG